ncbi:MAG: hypothetical protein A2498_15325 [Lentisphaerae bacterium RIFOXYC12_FULL_60_16]|nr:MAG: hypothetical protein A2498_15325 [Lentisphaerae bacterium RIFOXYC12_FULL_60_16]OGV78548.1 MAG: hypothetical protein A2340_12090 [Lentisphaerae bacterium RIFOXYB12_FULL_60_10]
MKRAESYDEIKPLIALCKAGRLFDVQEWIAAGKPVNPPPPPEKGARPRSPLQYAINIGFHSLVQVLLEGGAEIEASWKYNTLSHALQEHRFDIVQLLVKHGADPKTVDMYDVFHSWEPAIMEYFIELGADVETGNPLAQAFCSRIRTALRIFKKYKDRFPGFQDQLNIALRYHCKEGNEKWIALCLWAGADPYAPGPGAPEESDDEDGGISALEYAALYGHFEIFNMKQVRLDPGNPVLISAIRYAHGENASKLLVDLLKKGVNPNDQPNGGCSAIQSLLSGLEFSYDIFSREKRKNLDTKEAREKLKMIHILAQYGGKWAPKEDGEVAHARRSLLRMDSDYTVEFVWIMSKYQGCRRNDLDALLGTPSIRKHVRSSLDRIADLLSNLAHDGKS